MQELMTRGVFSIEVWVVGEEEMSDWALVQR